MIKMIVSDVDGTLLSHGYINPKCIESIKKAQDKGRWSQSAHLPVTTARNAGRVKGLRDFSFPLA